MGNFGLVLKKNHMAAISHLLCQMGGGGGGGHIKKP